MRFESGRETKQDHLNTEVIHLSLLSTDILKYNKNNVKYWTDINKGNKGVSKNNYKIYRICSRGSDSGTPPKT